MRIIAIIIRAPLTHLQTNPGEYHLRVFLGILQEPQMDYPSSSKIAFFTFVGTGEYRNGSMTLLARPVLMDRNSVV